MSLGELTGLVKQNGWGAVMDNRHRANREALRHDGRGWSHDAQACRRLWQAVLVSGVIDALRGDVANPATQKAPSYEMKARHEARLWIGSRNYHMVCALAGVDGARLARILHETDQDELASRIVRTSRHAERKGKGVARGAA